MTDTLRPRDVIREQIFTIRSLANVIDATQFLLDGEYQKLAVNVARDARAVADKSAEFLAAEPPAQNTEE